MVDIDLKTEYEYFLENLNQSYDLGVELCHNLRNYFENSEYPKDSTEYHNLEWQYFYLNEYLEKLYEDIYIEEGDSIIDFWGKND